MEVNKKYKVLSLDLWDTIIRRDCHPDEIKAMTAQFLAIKYADLLLPEYMNALKLMEIRIKCERNLGQKKRADGFDDEYELHSVIRTWLECVFTPETVIEEDYIQTLYQYELEKELENTRLDQDIVAMINGFQFDSLVIISDFYAGKSFIQKILDKNRFPFSLDRIFISCECGYNKRSSRLFRFVQQELGIEPYMQLHIGDNENSDVLIPKNLGINAIHYNPIQENEKRLILQKKFFTQTYNSILKYSDFPAEKKDLSIFFAGFISWIAEQCLKKGIKKLYFFTREGEFYKQLYDIWKQQASYKNYLPESYILEVSRLATFLPSLREVSITEMMRLWNQYSCQSMEAFFKSLHLNSERAKHFTEKYHIVYDEILTYPWQNGNVQALFQDREFIEWVQHEIELNKSLIVQYCAQKDFVQYTSEKIGIVDIGWRGTIQDNLCYIFPQHYIEGFYIGLVPFLNPQPDNAAKHGYINFSPKAKSLFHTLTPFEMICNSPNGSTNGYYYECGRVKALRQKENMEDSVFYSFTQKYQQEIIRKIQCIAEWSKSHYILSEQYHEAAFEALYHFCYYPDTECATAYFSLVHNEEFGVGSYVDKHQRLQLKLFLMAIFSKKGRKKLKDFLIETTWPQGYLTKYHLYPMLRIYNYLLEQYDLSNTSEK